MACRAEARLCAHCSAAEVITRHDGRASDSFWLDASSFQTSRVDAGPSALDLIQ